MEREAKLRLTAAEAGALERAWESPTETLRQRNYYFDTPERGLRERCWGLRLRHERLIARAGVPLLERRGGHPDAHDRFILTLKGPATEEGLWVSRIEEERPLDAASAEKILGSLQDSRTLTKLISAFLPANLPGDLGAAPLQLLGEITNERRVYHVALGAVGVPGAPGAQAAPRIPEKPRRVAIEVDLVRFPDECVEHELEIEWPESAGPFPEAALRDELTRIGIAWQPAARSKLARLFDHLDA